MLIRATVWLVVFLLAMGQPATLLAADYFGQVTFNGLPVPGATVTATKASTKASVTTNEDGIYHLANLADGLVDVFSPVARSCRLNQADDGVLSGLGHGRVIITGLSGGKCSLFLSVRLCDGTGRGPGQNRRKMRLKMAVRARIEYD